jgi:hypothetical protein
VSDLRTEAYVAFSVFDVAVVGKGGWYFVAVAGVCFVCSAHGLSNARVFVGGQDGDRGSVKGLGRSCFLVRGSGL